MWVNHPPVNKKMRGAIDVLTTKQTIKLYIDQVNNLIQLNLSLDVQIN